MYAVDMELIPLPRPNRKKTRKVLLADYPPVEKLAEKVGLLQKRLTQLKGQCDSVAKPEGPAQEK